MEYVVLVDEQDNPIGTAEKESVHSDHTPLHRGFSVFLFNAHKELLVTRRSDKKKTFPSIWTNSVCGHPSPDESYADAARRRLSMELGYDGIDVRYVGPYHYRFADNNGIIENEICPIFIAYTNTDPVTNPDEIDGWEWVAWDEFLTDINNNPQVYSPWCREEAKYITP